MGKVKPVGAEQSQPEVETASGTYPAVSGTSDVDLARPPVIEVVFSLTFESLRLLLVDYGKLAQHFAERYPVVSGHESTLELTSADNIVALRISSSNFSWHWRRLNSDPVVYPGHSQLLEQYISDLQSLSSILSILGLKKLQPRKMALAYWNHIPIPDDGAFGPLLTAVFPDIQWRQGPDRRLVGPDSVNWQTVFVPQQNSGLVVVELKAPAIAQGGPWSGSMVIDFKFVSQGEAAGETEISEIASWFADAHRWVFDCFVDLTCEKYRKQNWESL